MLILCLVLFFVVLENGVCLLDEVIVLLEALELDDNLLYELILFVEVLVLVDGLELYL